MLNMQVKMIKLPKLYLFKKQKTNPKSKNQILSTTMKFQKAVKPSKKTLRQCTQAITDTQMNLCICTLKHRMNITTKGFTKNRNARCACKASNTCTSRNNSTIKVETNPRAKKGISLSTRMKHRGSTSTGMIQ